MEHNYMSPPKLLLKFFKWFCDPSMHKYIEGDLFELYRERVRMKNKRKADLIFIIDIFLLFRPGIVRPLFTFQNTTAMGIYKNYAKIGWRNLLRNKGYSAINIGGLAAGMSVAILIGLWIYDELSFNTYHNNYDRIAQVYRMETREGVTQANTPHVTGLGTLLKNEYGAHFDKVVMVRAKTEERVIANNEKKFTESGFFVQPDGPAMLGLKMKHGTLTGLKDMNSILLSASVARKLFGDIDPVNQVISMDAKWDLKVTGVYEDLPKNSDFYEASFLATLDRYVEGWASLDSWDNYHMYIYVQLKEGADVEKVSSIIKDCTLPHVNQEHAESKPAIFLHPMRKWHLYSEWENGLPSMSKRMVAVWYYGAIGGFVLLLACINFMNLSTARSEKRAKEVGIRKSIGSLRKQLVQQFYGESFMVSGIAFVLALTIVQLRLPWFNSVSDKSITIPFTQPTFWLMGLSFVVITGLLAGSYPALYLSSFSPVKVLKGTFKSGKTAMIPRRILVVVQFSVSIVLTIGTIIVYQKLQFAKNRPVGYNRQSLIGLRAASPEFEGKYDVLRNELKNTGAVLEMGEANYAITDIRGWNPGFSWGEKTFDPAFNTIFVSHEYGKTVGWEFIDGRDFSREIASDSAGIVINESAAAIFGIKDPVGEILKWSPGGNDRGSFKILGVVKDMIKGSPYEPTFPSVIFLSKYDMQWLYIRLNPNMSTHESLPKVEKVFATLVPSAPFDYTFADEAYASKFQSEERIGKLATLFSVLAILISCLGLFGLAAFTVEQRTKEIGIRKVLGATVANLWQMLSKEFIVLILISCFIAVPVGYYFMNTWLNQFVYKTSIGWEVFLLSCSGGIAVTILTVSFQAVKAAVADPVKSLRSE
jgi:putative ABC transport system permease protein